MPDFDPHELAPRECYFLLTSLVVPRPIAWVSTLSEAGTRNLAPHSYFNMISSYPPIVHFTSTGVKDTLRNVRATGEFVVNVVSRDLLEVMNATAADFPPGEDEFAWAGLEPAPSATVAPPRVAAARASLECRMREVLSMGNGNMVFGDVLHVHVADGIWRDGRVAPELLEPVGRLSGGGYALVDEVTHLPRPRWKDVRDADTTPGG
ncbi:MAG TPA: flavin reductase family protein [Egibacteraceae bacterium]|nr:flavin reductase family protein [Egibacteraceae bacterium]